MAVDINGEKYSTFADYFNDETKVSKIEKERIEFEVELIGKLIRAREERNLSQRELAALSGVKQPQIANIEKMNTVPQLNTLLKILHSLGYKLSIVPV